VYRLLLVVRLGVCGSVNGVCILYFLSWRVKFINVRSPLCCLFRLSWWSLRKFSASVYLDCWSVVSAEDFLNSLGGFGFLVVVLGRRRRASLVALAVLVVVVAAATAMRHRLLTGLLTTTELAFSTELGYPPAVDMLEPFEKMGIPTTELAHHRGFLDVRFARGHGHVRHFRPVLAHDRQHVSVKIKWEIETEQRKHVRLINDHDLSPTKRELATLTRAGSGKSCPSAIAATDESLA
jgi:hypothetical protein